MMVTTELVGFVLLVLGTVFAAWWRIEARIRAAERDLAERLQQVHRQADLASRDLSAFKLEVARDYASVAHLQEVEKRLARAIDRLSTQLDKMPDRLSHAIQHAIKAAAE